MIIIQNILVKNIFEEFNSFADSAQNIAIFSRDIDLQKEKIIDIRKFVERIDELMEVSSLAESELNILLFLKFTIEAVQFELQMITCLKENKMDAAWSTLIQAQNYISIAASNHPLDSNQLNGYIQQLDSYEKILFPKMMYASVGGIIKKTKCSICEQEYQDCDHMKGKFYTGKLCVQEIHEIELEEISLVDNPASKMNRQLETEYNGKKVNYLTLK